MFMKRYGAKRKEMEANCYCCLLLLILLDKDDGDCFDGIQVGWEEARFLDLVEDAFAGIAESCFGFACYDVWLLALSRVFFLLEESVSLPSP